MDESGQQEYLQEPEDAEAQTEDKPRLKKNGNPIIPHKERHQPKRKPRDHEKASEFQSRIDFAKKLRAKRIYYSDAIRVMKKRYNLSARSAMRYLVRAREALEAQHAKEEGLTPEELRKLRTRKSEDFWNDMATDPANSARDRAMAQENLDLMWGVRSAQEHKLSGSLSGGVPAVVVTEIVVTTREEAKAILALEAERRRLAGPSGGGGANGCPAIS